MNVIYGGRLSVPSCTSTLLDGPNQKFTSKERDNESGLDYRCRIVDFGLEIWDAKRVVVCRMGDRDSILTYLTVDSVVRTPLVCIACLTIGLSLVVHGQVGATEVLQVQSNSKPVPAGVRGSVEMHFVIKQGFKIPKKPAPKMHIIPRPEFEVKGDLSFAEEGPAKDTEYFSKIKSLNLHFTPASGTGPGKYRLDGKLVYFYCSEEDKYCSRAVESIQIPIEVVAKK